MKEKKKEKKTVTVCIFKRNDSATLIYRLESGVCVLHMPNDFLFCFWCALVAAETFLNCLDGYILSINMDCKAKMHFNGPSNAFFTIFLNLRASVWNID